MRTCALRETQGDECNGKKINNNKKKKPRERQQRPWRMLWETVVVVVAGGGGKTLGFEDKTLNSVLLYDNGVKCALGGLRHSTKSFISFFRLNSCKSFSVLDALKNCQFIFFFCAR